MSAIVRSISHWTGGAGRASTKDKQHYHEITEASGNVVKGLEHIEDNVVTSDGDYAAHTLRLNTGSGGFAMAGMHGATESPFDPGPYPINEKQFEAHCANLAKFHSDYGILPITRRNCLTHAEVEPTLGVKQRGKWDLTHLPFKPELRGAMAVGDYMRERVNAYLGVLPSNPETNRPILRLGDRGAFVLDLQDLLIKAGHPIGKMDGIFGQRTEQAVLGFQGRIGLITDGVVGSQTWTQLMRAEAPPLRRVDEDDLRERGSNTIRAADNGQNVALAGAGTATVASVLEMTSGATARLTEAQSALDMAQGLINSYWPLLLALCAAGGIWYYFKEVKQARINDAQSGRNMGR